MRHLYRLVVTWGRLAVTACSLLALFTAPVVAQSRADQIALAVLPLPEAHRLDAKVLGYRDGALVTLRSAEGQFVCLADRLGDERFHVACYHRSLEPYMARGRELRAQGMSVQESIERRWEEIEDGRLEMPRHPAYLHQFFGDDPSSVSPAHTEGLRRLTVIYVAYATAETTGLPSGPAGGAPWLMFPGKPTAHVMISQ